MKKFENTLFIIQSELSEHHNSRQDVYACCIKERLEQGLLAYEKELQNSYNYIITKNSYNVLKKYNRRKR